MGASDVETYDATEALLPSGGGGRPDGRKGSFLGLTERKPSRAMSLTDQSESLAFMSSEEAKGRIPWKEMFVHPGVLAWPPPGM